jgi:FKBP-type peptidyl-prolyl cis-trans isomerase FkpA
MNKITILLGSALLVGLVACNKSKYDGYEVAENGLNYKFFTKDDKGTKVTEGDGVAFKYTFKLLSNDSLLVSSANASQDGSGVTKFVMPKSSFKGSLEDAMMMMSKNDSASFIVSADSFYLKTQRAPQLPPFLKPGDMIKVEIKMVEIKTKTELAENQKMQEAEMAKMAETEKPQIAQYVTDNKITVAPTASGLYYTETKKGAGALAMAGNEVTVNYTGKLLNGTVFDSSVGKPEPFKFVVGQGMVIPGWDEALQKMAKGGKATILVPSAIGYGARGAGGVIPPFAPLVFEVELIDINTNPAPMPQQMPGQ